MALHKLWLTFKGSVKFSGFRGLLGNRFPIGDTRFSRLAGHPEFPMETIHDHFKVQFPHSGDEHLPCLSIHMVAEGRILLTQAVQRLLQLVLVRLGPGFEREIHDRFRKLGGLQNQGLTLGAERVSCDQVGSHQGTDVPSFQHRQIFALICVHPDNLPDAFHFPLARIVTRLPAFNVS